MWVWRVCSILGFMVVVVPFISADFGLNEPPFTDESAAGTMVIAIVYTLLRLYLMVECFAAFRSSPASIYVNVDWSHYMGHFG
jgi:hypothetical protein